MRRLADGEEHGVWAALENNLGNILSYDEEFKTPIRQLFPPIEGNGDNGKLPVKMDPDYTKSVYTAETFET